MSGSHGATLTIVTGHSRGLGHALVAGLLREAHAGDGIVGIARQASTDLQAQAQGSRASLQQWQMDLSDAAAAAQRLHDWLLGQRATAPWQQLRLINNAGVIPTIAPLAQLHAQDITQGLRVGLEATMLLTNAFLRASAQWPAAPDGTPVQRKVLNISSGLGRRPMAAQAVYCAAKAGMDLFSQCLALEEARKPDGARVVSLAPGVIATDMQQHLRSAPAQDFPDLPRFRALLEEGRLQTPQETAARILPYLNSPRFGEPVIDDVRHWGAVATGR